MYHTLRITTLTAEVNVLKKSLIVGDSAPSHLVFGILRFRTNIWHFIIGMLINNIA